MFGVYMDQLASVCHIALGVGEVQHTTDAKMLI